MTRRLTELRLTATAIPAVYILVAVAYLADPATAHRTVVGEDFGTTNLIWNLAWLTGGAAAIVGHLRHRHDIEDLGLALLIAGWAMAFTATCIAQGFDLRALAYPIFAMWAIDRSRTLKATP